MKISSCYVLTLEPC